MFSVWLLIFKKESDASLKNIKRGDIFTGVNGTDLTVSNYRSLLFGDNLSYTLNMADYSSSSITPNGVEVALTKVEISKMIQFI